MKIEDLDKFAGVLNTAARAIKEASDTVKKNPMQAMAFVPKIMDHFKEINSFGNFSNITASLSNDREKNVLHSAINTFLTSTKDAQEKVGAMGAALFGNPQFKSLTANLEQVKKSLERGKRVEKTEEDSGV